MANQMHSFLLLMCSVCLLRTHAASSESEQCKYKGYTPGGILPQIGAITVTPPQFETSMLDNVLGYFNDGAGVTAATLGMMDAFGKAMQFSPHVAASLGAVSVAIGFASKNPSPQDIVNKAHEAVEFLAEEVNIRMDQMKDYVDYRVVNLEKDLMRNRYREFFDRWIECAQKRSPSDEEACQRRVESDMNSARFHFEPLYRLFENEDYTPFFTYRYVATWQWMNENKGRYVSFPIHHDVKNLEAGLIPFRNFATLHMMVLETLAGTFKDRTDPQSREHYKYYLAEIVDRGNHYVKFAKWAYEWIFIRQYEENMYFGVKRRAGGGPASAKRGGFLGTIKCSGGRCEVQCSQMEADNKCTYTGDHGDASQICDTYMLDMKKDIQQFWQTNLLDVAKRWEDYVKVSKETLKSM